MTKAMIGWDIGGAHIKAAVVNEQGAVIRVIQQQCPLWQGLEVLQQAITKVINDVNDVNDVNSSRYRHAVTMTGELVDLFASRRQGVEQIINVVSDLLGEDKVLIYCGNFGFLEPGLVTELHLEQIASTNWLASVSYLASHVDAGLLVDIGSTTSDILLFSQGQCLAQGYTDHQRLSTQELVYTGIIRTPVMAVTQELYFQQQPLGLMAEHFATMADVYRIIGELNERHDQMPTADNADKTIPASCRRLARMIGCDANDYSNDDWRQMAEQLKTKQLQRLQQACLRQLQRRILTDTPILVGAGVGRFLARQLATMLGLAYQDFSEIMADQLATTDMTIADCAPAVAVACLAARTK